MPLRILAVDDFEPWRRFVSSALSKEPNFQPIIEVSDGLSAVYQSQDLQPDLILLDIGLPRLNGIKAAAQIREVSPTSKILFLTEESSPEIAEAALEAGGSGYLVKSDAGRELLSAMNALAAGKRYICARLAGRVFFGGSEDDSSSRSTAHELQIYSDDTRLVDGFTRFVANGLNSGNAVVVLASGTHRQGVFHKLQSQGFQLNAIIKSGTYIARDAGETLSSFMVDDQPDPEQFWIVASRLIETASKAPNGASRRVFACGECAPTLWKQGKFDAALRVEELWDAASRKYGLSTLCGYISEEFKESVDQRIFQAICSMHSPGIVCEGF